MVAASFVSVDVMAGQTAKWVGCLDMLRKDAKTLPTFRMRKPVILGYPRPRSDKKRPNDALRWRKPSLPIFVALGAH